MSAIPELKWTPHHVGDEWQLLFSDNRSLYYQTAEEAKAEAERDNRWKFKLMRAGFKAEKLADDGRKHLVVGEFIFPFAELDLSDQERQLRSALEADSLQLVIVWKLDEIFFGGLPDHEQTSVERDLKASGYWLHLF
jgi:hypothetical protein